MSADLDINTYVVASSFCAETYHVRILVGFSSNDQLTVMVLFKIGASLNLDNTFYLPLEKVL